MPTRSWIDINCDCGESYGNWRMGDDERMFELITTANLACGFHAGDPRTMLRSVRAAQAHGVVVGAHPGLPDLMGFGRRPMAVTAEELYAYWLYQIGSLQAMLHAHGMALNHAKPHGAMYTIVRGDDELGEAAAQAVAEAAPGAVVYWPTREDAFGRAAQRRGIPVVTEIYPDLKYRPDGSLIIEREKAHLDLDHAAEQVRRFVAEGVVQAVDGSLLEVDATSICIHGDGPNAIEVATTVRRVLEEAGCTVRAASAEDHATANA